MATRTGDVLKRFKPGVLINDRYEILEKLGWGWEGAVFLIEELATGIPRAAKFFLPKRNVRNRASRYYAKKLHELRDCPIVIQYHGVEEVDLDGEPLTALISEYIEGITLDRFLKKLPGKRMQPFMALHFLHAMVEGIEKIHRHREFHGDIHLDNVLVRRYGLHFEIKLIDFYNWGMPKREQIQKDICDTVEVFHTALGGRMWYHKMPPSVKRICCGLRRDLIIKRFPHIGHLKAAIENFEWE